MGTTPIAPPGWSNTPFGSKSNPSSHPNVIFHQRNASDVELASRKWSAYKDGFPPGMTVDELKQFRRKRAAYFNRPLDNLHVEEGSLKDLKTEYNRRFIAPTSEELSSHRSNRPSDAFNWWPDNPKDLNSFKGEYSEKFMDYPRDKPKSRNPCSNLKLPDRNEVPMDCTTEKSEKYIPIKITEKTKSLRRNTALKLEGELITETEFKREFHPHSNVEKVRPLKRQTFLKLEGLFENLSSEQKEKYIAYLKSQRPPLAKRKTELQLNGDYEFNTECSSKFADPGVHPRVLVRKRSTSLKLEGEAEFLPEYQQSYVPVPRAKAMLVRPIGHLTSEGELDLATEFRSQYIQYPITPRHVLLKNQNNIQMDGGYSLNPEYREKFISHGRSKSEIIRRRDNLNLEGEFSYETENSKYKYIPSFKKSSPDLQQATEESEKNNPENQSSFNYKTNTEYNSQFLDFPRSRPTVRKPTASLQSNGSINQTNEKRSEFRSYGTLPKNSPRLRHGSFSAEPEYKNKFVESQANTHKVLKTEKSLPKDYPSFHVLENTKSVPSRPITPHVPETRLSTPTNQPSYRLEVHNVDDQPKGFHRSPERIFPQEAAVSRPFVSTEKREAAVDAALKRRQQLEENISNFPTSRRLSKSNVDENVNTHSFQILESLSTENKDWSPRLWTDSNCNTLPPSVVT